MPVSLVLTVLNEARSLPQVLDTIAAQTVLPDEVVVCDGGSTDATLQILQAETRFPVRVISEAGANISRGRNLAIAAAQHEFIACTDAGVRLNAVWLEKLIAPWRAESDGRRSGADAAMEDGGVGGDVLSVVRRPSSVSAPWTAGFFLPDPQGTFETALGATVMPALRDIRPETFLPSSRSIAFEKSAWKDVGGYPEWLDYCEDLIFDLALRERFGLANFAPEAIAYFRPRGSMRAFFKQYYLYARGDGKSNLWLKRHLIRYATYLVAFPVLIALLVVLPGLWKLLPVLALLGGVVAYTRAPYRRLLNLGKGLSAGELWKARLLVPAIRVVGDVAKMLGYPVGVIWRLRQSNLRASPSSTSTST